MKLQVAIDRVSIERAAELVKIFDGIADIIEIGTSLIKDYGLLNLREVISLANRSIILGDIKANDEGEYEFIQGYEQGFDLLTVMGGASFETIKKCYEVSERYNKEMMIDLLECSYEKINEISIFDNAIYCLHTSMDKKRNKRISEEIKQFKDCFPNIKRIAIAGGINIESINEINEQGIEIVIVGSAIISNKKPSYIIQKFDEVINL